MKMIMTFLTIFLLFSCSDLKKEQIQKAELSDSRFEVACKLDTAALGNILTHKITDELNCLRDWLTLLTKVVKSDRPGEMGFNELKQFLQTGLGSDVKISDNIIPIAQAVYELNYLIGSGERDYVTVDELDYIMDLTIEFNKEIIPLYLEFSTSRKVSYSWHQERRRENYEGIKRFADELKSRFNPKRSKLASVNLEAILDVFSPKDSSNSVIEKIKKFLIVKQMIVGGDPGVINYKELYVLLGKLPSLASIVYDAVKFKDIEFASTWQTLDFMNAALRSLGRDVVFQGRGADKDILSVSQLESYIYDFYPSPLVTSVFKSKKLVQLVKDAFFGEGEYFTGNQLRNFLSFIRKVGKKASYFYKVYQENKYEIESKDAFKTITLKNTEARNQEEIDYLKSFKSVFESYLFFRGDKKSARYSFNNKTNVYAMLEYTVLEEVLYKMFSYWEKRYPCDSNGFKKAERCQKEDYKASLTQAQFLQIIMELSDFLSSSGIISKGREAQTAKSIWQLGDLFLTTSNGDNQLSFKEMAEFGVVLISASGLSADVYDRLRMVCPNNYKNELEPECFKEKFLDKIFQVDDKGNFENYLPLLKKYYISSSSAELSKMVDGTVGYGRSCQTFRNGEPVYISEGDIFMILAGMLNIESLIIRFDKNKNSTIEGDEFMKMANLFDNAIEDAVKKQAKGFYPILDLLTEKKYRRKILRYIFKYGESPKTGKAVGLLFKGESSLETHIPRSGFTKLLEELGAGEVDFDYCETLR